MFTRPTFVLLRFAPAMLACVLLSPPAPAQWESRATIMREVEKTFGEPPGMTRLDPVDRVWADKKNKRVVVDGYIALVEGQLEMLACLVGTKEHESVVAAFTKARTVHAGLLAVGAEQGKPVSWEPNYTAPTGSEIQVFALWRDAEGNKQNIDARQWVRVVGTENEVLDTNWVFAGSTMWRDPDSGEEIYQAESGDLICVSNFTTATLDVPINSSHANRGLLFAAFKQRIPPLDTPVRLVLQVVDKKTAQTVKQSPVTTAAAESRMAENLDQLNTMPK